MNAASTATSPAAVMARWRWPRIRARDALVLLFVFLAVGLVQGTTLGFAKSGTGSAAHVVGHLTGAFAAWLALPLVHVAVANARGSRSPWVRFALVHAFGYAAFTAMHVTTMMMIRVVLVRIFSVAVPSLPLGFQVLWELQSDVVLYGGLAALLTLLHTWQRQRAADVRAAKLESQLTAARLELLTAQLDPHFLFNALNTLGAVMYEDLERTDRLIANLGELLRASLGPTRATWSLGEEIAHARRYVELLEARFEDRLAVSWAIPSDMEATCVPRFVVQTLVENAVKHNQDRPGTLTVRLKGETAGGSLSLTVEDDGVGFSRSSPPASGSRGLGRLVETLRLLHGERATLETIRTTGGGARVVVKLPRECAT